MDVRHSGPPSLPNRTTPRATSRVELISTRASLPYVRTPAAWLAAAALVLSVAACGQGGSEEVPPPPLDTPAGRLPPSKSSHAIVIVMENKEYDDVIDAHDAPYLSGLASRYAAPHSLFGIRHPSLPNYLALIGGDTFGIG